MRIVLVVSLLFIAAPALAQFWGHYENTRFGYGIDIPPLYQGNGENPAGDGQVFFNIEAAQGLTVWAGPVHDGFAKAVTLSAAVIRGEGWAITEQSSTPDWSALAAMRDHRLIYQRMILLCDGKSFAAFRSEFNIRDLGKMNDILNGLVRSLVPVGC